MPKQQNVRKTKDRELEDPSKIANQVKSSKGNPKVKTGDIDVGKNLKTVKGRFAEKLVEKWVKEHFPHLELVETNVHFTKFGELDLVFLARSMCNVGQVEIGSSGGAGDSVTGREVSNCNGISISRETKYTIYAFEVRSQYCSCVGFGMKGASSELMLSTESVDRGHINRSGKYHFIHTSLATEFRNNINYKGIYSAPHISTNNLVIRDSRDGAQDSFGTTRRCLKCKSIRPISALKKKKLLTCAKLLKLNLVEGKFGAARFGNILKNIDFGSRETQDIDVVSILAYLRVDLNGNNLMFDMSARGSQSAEGNNPSIVESLSKVSAHPKTGNKIFYKMELFKLGITD